MNDKLELLTSNERTGFEAWADNNGYGLRRKSAPFTNSVDTNGDYTNTSTQDAWEAWQARASLPVETTEFQNAEVPPDVPVSRCESHEWIGDNACPYCQIEQTNGWRGVEKLAEQRNTAHRALEGVLRHCDADPSGETEFERAVIFAHGVLKGLSDEPRETPAPQAPIATLMVAEGHVTWTHLKAPGLPNGMHDLYCEPESVAPYMRREESTWVDEYNSSVKACPKGHTEGDCSSTCFSQEPRETTRDDARDAARYRFLRQPGNAIVYAKDRNAWGKNASGHVAYDTAEQLDAAVDAARGAVEPAGKQPDWEAEYKKLAGVYTRTGLEEFIAKHWPGNKLVDVSAVEPPRELSPSEADEVQIGRSQAELAVLKKDGRSYEIRRIAGQALEVITRLWAARSTTKATGQSVAREDVFECPATRVTCRRHCQYGDCAIRGSENGPERRLAPLWSGDPPGSEVPAFSRQAAGLGPFPRPPDPGSDAALFAVQRENERLREALRGVMECSGTSCRHYHIAHDALQADAGAARDG